MRSGLGAAKGRAVERGLRGGRRGVRRVVVESVDRGVLASNAQLVERVVGPAATGEQADAAGRLGVWDAERRAGILRWDFVRLVQDGVAGGRRHRWEHHAQLVGLQHVDAEHDRPAGGRGLRHGGVGEDARRRGEERLGWSGGFRRLARAAPEEPE